MRLAGLLLTLLMLSSLAQARPQSKTLQVDSEQRRYLVVEPRKKGESMPLLLVFHGGNGDARKGSRMGFSKLARKRGYLVVYPEAIEGHWNDGRANPRAFRVSRFANDVKFIDQLLDTLLRDYSVDTSRVYATGVSNGGIMSHRLGVDLSHRLAAIAPVIGGVGKELSQSFSPRNPMPVMIIQGTADPLVPYQGGAVGRRRRARGHVVSTEQAVRLWSDHNGCAPAVVAKLPDTTDDGCWVERFTHTGGRDGSEVVLYKVHGGGHTLPGGIQYLPKRLVGPVCRDFNGVDAIADFFDRHHR